MVKSLQSLMVSHIDRMVSQRYVPVSDFEGISCSPLSGDIVKSTTFSVGVGEAGTALPWQAHWHGVGTSGVLLLSSVCVFPSE